MTEPRLKVLVVTANPGSTWYAGLVAGGFTVRVTGSANVALHSTLDGSPDVAVIDFTTPGLDGLALAWSLRDIQRSEKDPLLLVALKANDTDTDRQVSTTAAIDLSLRQDDPGNTGVIVSVLNRFREFLADLRLCGRLRYVSSHSAIVAPLDCSGPLSN